MSSKILKINKSAQTEEDMVNNILISTSKTTIMKDAQTQTDEINSIVHLSKEIQTQTDKPYFDKDTHIKEDKTDLFDKRNRNINDAIASILFFKLDHDKRPYINVTVNERIIPALIDTGAEVTVVGLNIVGKVEDWGKLYPCVGSMRLADSSVKIAPLGEILVEYTTNNTTKKVPTVILKQPTKSLILGTDFLEAFGIGITDVRHHHAKIFNADELQTYVDTVESDKPNPIVASPDIVEDTLLTAEGEDDTELDIEPEKQALVSMPHVLTEDQRIQLEGVLRLYIRATTEGELNCTDAIQHHINTGTALPVCKPQYSMSPTKFQLMKHELDKMVKQGIVSEIVNTAWRSPMHSVKKKDGGVRLVLDARELNQITIGNAKPIRNTNTILAQMEKSIYKSTIDLSQAFHQIALSEDSREKTSFALGSRLYCYNRMTMGLKGSPATLATLVDDIFEDLYPKAFAYVDDFIICTQTFEEHIDLLRIIAERLKEKKLAISSEKSRFAYKQIEFLGYLLTENGLCANPQRIKPIENWTRPTTVKDVRRFLGSAGWYRRFIQNYAEIAAPLSDLIKTRKTKVDWNEQAEIAFENLKLKLMNAPVLSMCDYSRPFKIFCDASDFAGAAILTQDFEDGNRPIYYHSFKFTPTQQKYSATERECLAVIKAVEKFRPYFEGTQFFVVTDHSALRWVMNTTERKGRIARWAIRLQAYAGDMVIIHRSGIKMEFPDALSRAIEVVEINPNSIDKWYRNMLLKASDSELDRYKVENGRLYHRKKFDSYAGEKIWTLCVPLEQRESVMKENHDDASHLGVWKVIRRIKSNYYWPNMYETAYNYIRNCSQCKSIKPSNENRRTPIGNYRDPKCPGRMLSIDLIGELPSSKFGHRHIFVVIDCFSKFVWVKTMAKASANAVVNFLKDTVFASNGCPEIIISDNGVQFTSQLFKELCKSRGIEHHRTPRNHPKANPVESTNKTIKTAIKSYLVNDKNHASWENNLQKIIRDLNATPHTSTGSTPQYLHFGRELVAHANEYKHLVDINPERELDEDKKALAEEDASHKMSEAYEKRRTRYNRTAKKRTFKENTVVYIPRMKLSNKAEKYAQKLAPAKVQCVIKKKVGSDIYEVVGMNGKDLGRIHSDDICIHAIESGGCYKNL